MTEIVLFVGLFLGNCKITSYQSIPSQTDSSPNYTSIGERTHKGGVAVSRDLLKRWGGPLNYGDYVYIEDLGIYKINDVMSATSYEKSLHKRIPIKQSFDIWVPSLQEEKKIGVQHHKVYFLNRRIK